MRLLSPSSTYAHSLPLVFKNKGWRVEPTRRTFFFARSPEAPSTGFYKQKIRGYTNLVGRDLHRGDRPRHSARATSSHIARGEDDKDWGRWGIDFKTDYWARRVML